MQELICLIFLISIFLYLIFEIDVEPEENDIKLNKYQYLEENWTVENIQESNQIVTNQEGIPKISAHNTKLPLHDVPGVVLFYNTTITPNEKYAVFGANTPNYLTKISYAYNLPLATRAWNRIGFGSVVLISGQPDKWQNQPILKTILDELIQQSQDNKFSLVIMFIICEETYNVGIAQLGRLFVTNFLLEYKTQLADTYFLTADVDLFPFRPAVYELSKNHEILVVNKLKGSYNEILNLWVALSCVGASFSVWQKTINFVDCDINLNPTYSWHQGNSVPRNGCWYNFLGQEARNANAIFNYVRNYAKSPKIYDHGIIKTDKRTWYTDQNLLSLRISQYVARHGLEILNLQDNELSRIDRGSPMWWHQVDRYSISLNKDSHTLQETYILSEWWKLRYLVDQMFPVSEIRKIEKYRLKFINTWLETSATDKQLKEEYRQLKVINSEQTTNKFWQTRHKGENLQKVWVEIFPRKYFYRKSAKLNNFAKWNPKVIFGSIFVFFDSKNF